MNDRVNIALAGWSGAGTSTVSMILALLLNREYIYMGSVMRTVVSRMGRSSGSVEQDLPNYESELQPFIGRLMDRYTDSVLINGDGVVLETDTGAFRVGRHPKVWSVFIKASFEERAKHIAIDGRSGGEENLRKRDEILRDEYLKLWGFDIFEEQLIEKQFNEVVDAEGLDLRELLTAVLSVLARTPLSQELPVKEKLDKAVEEFSLLAGGEGKKHLRQLLSDRGLLKDPKEILREMVVLYELEIVKFPEAVRKVMSTE